MSMSNLQQTEVAPPPLPAAVNIDIDSTTARESTVVAEQQETPNEETPKAENAAVAIDVAVAQMEEDKLDEESNILQQRQKRKINAPCRLHDASEWEKVMDGPQLKKAAIKPHTNTNANTPTTLATAKDLTTAFASTGDEKQNKENEQENEHEDWRAKDTGTGLDKNGRPQRRTKGVAPARLADADQWKKVMECPQLKKDIKYLKSKTTATATEMQIQQVSFQVSKTDTIYSNEKPQKKRGRPPKAKATGAGTTPPPLDMYVKPVTKKKFPQQYLVDEVLGHRVVNNTSDGGCPPSGKKEKRQQRGVEYLIRWSNCPESDNSWEPEGNLAGCKRKVDEYWHQKSTWKLMQCSSEETPSIVSKVMYTDQKFRIIKDQDGRVFFYFLP